MAEDIECFWKRLPWPCQQNVSMAEFLNYSASLNSTFSPTESSTAEQYPCVLDPPSLHEVCTAIGHPSWVRCCIGLSAKCWPSGMPKVNGVMLLFFFFSRKRTSEYALRIEAWVWQIFLRWFWRHPPQKLLDSCFKSFLKRDQHTYSNKNGFRSWWGCTDQMHYLRRIRIQR